MKYTKPPLPFHDQVGLLQQRGLAVNDTAYAAHVLEHINYYRVSAYFIPFQSNKDHNRAWNRTLAIRPLPNDKDADWNRIDNSKIFGIFLLIKKLMHFRDKWDEWCEKLLVVLGQFPNVDVRLMGFPDNWRTILSDHLQTENYE